MGRSTLTTPYPRLTNEAVQPVVKGGTGNTTNASTVSTLNLIPKSSLNAPNGILTKVGGVVPSETIASAGVVSGATVTGPTSMLSSSNATFTITNYDSTRGYDVVAVGGSVSRNVETISYTAPAVAGSYGFTVNGKRITVSVSVPTVNTPSVTSPVNGSTGLSNSVIVTSSAFATTGGSDTHYSSDWQLSTNSTFTNVVQSATDSAVSKTSWSISGLNANTTYYLRVRHRGVLLGYSGWSNTVSFTTRSSFYPAVFTSTLFDPDYRTSTFGINISISNDGNVAIVHSVAALYFYRNINGSWVIESKQTVRAQDTAPSVQLGDKGIAISADGSRVISVHNGDVVHNRPVNIFDYKNGSWIRTELVLNASHINLTSGFWYNSCAISDDGNTIAISCVNNRTKTLVFKWTGTSWLESSVIAEGMSSSVAISGDGTKLVIGDESMSFGGVAGGGFRYYEWNGTSWIKISDIVPGGTSETRYGSRCSLSSDGKYICVETDGDTDVVGMTFSIYFRDGNSFSKMGYQSSAGGYVMRVPPSFFGNKMVYLDEVAGQVGLSLRYYDLNGTAANLIGHVAVHPSGSGARPFIADGGGVLMYYDGVSSPGSSIRVYS